MYKCVQCLTPSRTLYHQLNSKSSKSKSSNVKLTRCRHCHHDVDPYVEQEALLIGIDLILLRYPAYRHLLFNRHPFASFNIYGNGVDIENDVKHDKDNDDISSLQDTHHSAGKGGRKAKRSTGNPKKAFLFLFVAAFLDAYHKWESIPLRHERNSQPYPDPSMLFLYFMACSFLEHVLLLLGITIIANTCYNNRPDSQDNPKNIEQNSQNNKHLQSKLFLAVVLPTSFRFISIFILIWENSDTVRILGSCFVLLYQSMTIQTIIEDFYMVKGHAKKSRLEQTFPGISCLACGMVMRTWIPFVMKELFSYYEVGAPLNNIMGIVSPCSGYEISVPSFVHEWKNDSWRSLCLT